MKNRLFEKIFNFSYEINKLRKILNSLNFFFHLKTIDYLMYEQTFVWAYLFIVFIMEYFSMQVRYNKKDLTKIKKFKKNYI